MSNHTLKPVQEPKKPHSTPVTQEHVRFCRFFTHWRSGKVMDAWEYGYKAWPIGGKRA